VGSFVIILGSWYVYNNYMFVWSENISSMPIRRELGTM